MSAGYPLHLKREIDRRWLHRFVPTDRPVPLDRPKHPNDIRPLPKRPDDRTDLHRKFESIADEPRQKHGEQARTRVQ